MRKRPGEMPHSTDLRELSDAAARWATQAEMRSKLRGLGIDPDAADPHDAFFADEHCPQPMTTRTCWNFKWHERLTLNMFPYTVFRLKPLVIFRETIGYFPKTTDRGRFPGWPEEKSAFSAAWEPYWEAGSGNVGLAAWEVLDQIRKGTFLDDDSAEISVREVQMRGQASPQPVPTAGSAG